MSTEVMLNWRELARQRLRWKRGAVEDLLGFGFTRRTIKGWGLQLASVLGILASIAYLGTLLGLRLDRAAPAPGNSWRITVCTASERLVTVRSLRVGR